MSEQELRNLIMKTFRSKPIMESIGDDDDFFDLGASSLTVVDLQLDIEKELGITVPTKVLMSQPSVSGWVSAYSEKLSEQASAA